MNVVYLRYQVSFQNITSHLKAGSISLQEAVSYAKQLTSMDIKASTVSSFTRKWASEIKKYK